MVTSDPLRRVRLHGYSPWTPERLASHASAGRDLAELPGDFVVTWEEQKEGSMVQCLASSALSALPYFHALSADGQSWHHGASVFDCVRSAGRSWTWNDSAVMSVALLGHTVGEETLDDNVMRVPPLTQMRFSQGKLKTDSSAFWRCRPSGNTESNPVGAMITTLKEVMQEMSAGRETCVSLSAGYDSRLLLATLLKLGHRPDLATMGSRDSTDVVVASKIAADSGLPHRRVDLEPQDYLRHAREIVSLTGGSKTADHWHTYLLAKAAGFSGKAIHWAGSNGEFMRSYYFDKGILAGVSKWLPWPLAVWFMSLKNSPARRLPVPEARGILASRPLARSVLRGLARHLKHKRGWLNSLDQFYATQRVRHFIGNGLALYSGFNTTCSPFLDQRFLRAASSLPRHWKLNSRMHRALIKNLEPRLLDFPVAEDGISMKHLERSAYWMRSPAVKGYSVFKAVFTQGDGRDILADSPHLDRFLNREARLWVVDQGKGGIAGTLLSLHYAAALAAGSA